MGTLVVRYIGSLRVQEKRQSGKTQNKNLQHILLASTMSFIAHNYDQYSSN